MGNTEKFNDILDACLERLARGDTLEQCLTSYPEHTAELEPLLRTAAATRQAVMVVPRAEARTTGWEQISAALREAKPARSSIFAAPRWAIAIAVLAVFFVISGAMVSVAAGSLPDSSLYPVKLATENVQLTFTFTKFDKTELLVKLADRRVSEITAMAERGKPDKMTAPAKRLDELLVAVTGPVSAPPALIQSFAVPSATALDETTTTMPSLNETAPALSAPALPPRAAPPEIESKDITLATTSQLPPEQAELITLLRRYQAEDPQKLQAVLSKATPETRVLLESIISRYQTGYQQAIDALQSPSP